MGAEGQIKIPFILAYSFKVPIQFPPGNADVSTPACRLLSLAYMKLPRANCFTLFRQWIRCAFNLTLLRAVRSRAARMPMIAIVTSNSISVKARFVFTVILPSVGNSSSFLEYQRCLHIGTRRLQPEGDGRFAAAWLGGIILRGER